MTRLSPDPKGATESGQDSQQPQDKKYDPLTSSLPSMNTSNYASAKSYQPMQTK
jgi:hypothetical protein